MRTTLARIPYTRGLELRLDRIADGEVQMTLPDADGHRNLAGTAHAGLLFTFGETVAGVAAGLETLERAFPFARRAAIRYLRPARGALRGAARVAPADLQRVLDELARAGRSELTVHARLAGADERAVAELEVDYAFRAREERS